MKYITLVCLCLITVLLSACAKDSTIQVDAVQAKQILSGEQISDAELIDDLATTAPPLADIVCMTDRPHCSCRGVNSCNVFIAVCAEVGYEPNCSTHSGTGEPRICTCGEL